MADIVDSTTRSRIMSRIRGKNTSPELTLRRALYRQGFRFTLHDNSLPGCPDVKFTGRRAVIFVHGCYWHRHRGCHWCTTPASRQDFWGPKLEGNARRDAKNIELLRTAGWRVGIVWECALRPQWRDDTVHAVAHWLRSRQGLFETAVLRSRNVRPANSAPTA